VAVEGIAPGIHWAEPFAITVDELLENTRTGNGVRIATYHPDGVHIVFASLVPHVVPARMPLSLWRKILNGEQLVVLQILFDRLDNGI
jgi:hypothetical protein